MRSPLIKEMVKTADVDFADNIKLSLSLINLKRLPQKICCTKNTKRIPIIDYSTKMGHTIMPEKVIKTCMCTRR